MQLGLEEFWGGSLQASQEVSVPPAFTAKGKEKIDAFVKEIESALVDPLVIASQKLEFNGWYCKAYLDVWYGFAEGFPAGAERLQGREERQQVAATGRHRLVLVQLLGRGSVVLVADRERPADD